MKIGIIGYGSFGRLWAGLMTEFGEVIVYDKKVGKKHATATASARHSEAGRVSTYISGAAQIKFAPLKEVTACDILFLLVPISEMENICRKIAPLLKPKTIVLDACSVKIKPAKAMLKYLPAHQPIIATHPLFGPDSVARLGLTGLKFVICPLRNTNSQLKTLEGMLNRLKLKIITATPEEHDRQMASSQALVHFIGRGLTALDLRPQAIATPDYEALLKMNVLVQNNTWQLFFDMMRYNPYSGKLRKRFIRNIAKIQKKIQNVD